MWPRHERQVAFETNSTMFVTCQSLANRKSDFLFDLYILNSSRTYFLRNRNFIFVQISLSFAKGFLILSKWRFIKMNHLLHGQQLPSSNRTHSSANAFVSMVETVLTLIIVALSVRNLYKCLGSILMSDSSINSRCACACRCRLITFFKMFSGLIHAIRFRFALSLIHFWGRTLS